LQHVIGGLRNGLRGGTSKPSYKFVAYSG